MFVPGTRGGRVWQGPNGQPINQPWHALCICGCHHPKKPPPAVEARLCKVCATERFQSWQGFVDVLMKGE